MTKKMLNLFIFVLEIYIFFYILYKKQNHVISINRVENIIFIIYEY
jgi:hypothetical protein